MVNPYSIPNLITGIFCVVVGIFVFIKNRKSSVSIAFLTLTTSVAIWQVGTFRVLEALTADMAFLWCRFTYWGAVFIPVATYHLVVAFLGKEKQRKFVFIGYWIAALVFLPLSQTKFFLSGVYEYFWGFWFKASFLHPVFLLFFAALMSASFMNLYYGYKKEELPLQKLRIRFLFIALGVAYLGVVDFPSDYGFALYPFGYFPLIVYLTIMAYAIIRYRLIDVSVALTRTGLFAIVYSFVVGVPFAVSVFGKQWLIALLGDNWWLAPMLLMAMLATIGPFVFTFLQTKAENILLREQKEYQEIIRETALEVARIRHHNKIISLITKVFLNNVRVLSCGIYLFDKDQQEFVLKSVSQSKSKGKKTLKKNNVLIEWFNKHRTSIVYEEVKRNVQFKADDIFEKLEKEMRNLKATVIIPSFLEDNIICLFVLGNKQSGSVYSTTDLEVFSVLADQSALAIDNALIYENIEEKVRQRTQELVEVQSQLVQAEKLATVGTLAGGVAHEINNPLTAILTNTQMLLDSDELDADDKESLELVEEATKRCRAIVKKLMVYARKPLEEGKLVKIDLSEIINNVVDFLKYQLEQENINLVLEKVDKDCFISANKNEIEQVITNIILNGKDAIQRVKKSGSVTLRVFNNKDNIRFEIEDQGQGIPDEVLSKIFDPFFTTKDVGKGLGLGLSICQGIVEKHGGKISANNAVDKKGKVSGAVFIVELPIAKDK